MESISSERNSERQRIWLICIQISWHRVFFFCVKKVKGSNDELVSPTTQPEGNHCTLIHHALIYDRQSNEGMFHVRNKNDFLLFVLLLI